MKRLIVSVLLMCVGRAAADEPSPPATPAKQLTIRATAAPVPALRYKLLPELRDSTPGNAVQLYYRAFAPDWSSTVRSNAKLMEKIDAARERPLTEVKADNDLAFIRKWGMLLEVDRAARRSYCDWELTARIREDGINLLLPDVQSMREFAKYLAVRTRLELAVGDFDAAAYSIQTTLAMGRHVADAPTLIQTLVGIAIDSVALEQVEEWIRTPGSPNLFWALSTLPRPFVDMRKPYEGERLFVDQMFPGYREALRAKKMAPQGPEAFDKTRNDLRGLSENPIGPAMMLAAVRKYTPAKKYLIDAGWQSANVDALPAIQVVMLAEVAEYDRWYDEMMKWMGHPYPKVRKEIEAADKRFKDRLAQGGDASTSLVGMLLPATEKVQFAANRVDRRVAVLMVIEALRLHATATGSLPDALADVTSVPLLPDPVTGVAFVYERNGDRATLTLPGDQRNGITASKYELILAK